MKWDTQQLAWINEPKTHIIEPGKVEIVTEPGTDFWQRTYYGFQNDNAPGLLMEIAEPYFSFEVKVSYDSKQRFDQAGVLVYQDSDNWFKAASEYENDAIQRLGSVVTNRGYSDWATTDIDASIKEMYYRLSRRESDFQLEYAYDGEHYKQMRIFHLFEGGGTIRMGLYACSPEQSSFRAVFTEMAITECKWQAHH